MQSIVQTAKEWGKAATWDKSKIPDLTGRTYLVTGVRLRLSGQCPCTGWSMVTYVCAYSMPYLPECVCRRQMEWGGLQLEPLPRRTRTSLCTGATWKRHASAF